MQTNRKAKAELNKKMEFKFTVFKNKITKIQCIIDANLFSSESYLN